MYLVNTGRNQSRAGLGVFIESAAGPSSGFVRGGETINRTILPKIITMPAKPVSTLVPVIKYPSVPIAKPPVSAPTTPVYAAPPPPQSLPMPTPPAAPPIANQGTPVPAGFPTNQIFVNTDGSFWQYSTAAHTWQNVGIPYGAGSAANVPPALPTGGTPSAPTTTVTNTVAPAPSAASGSPTVADTGYQAILDWLSEDTLLATIGFSGIPNWITGGAAGLLAWKLMNSSKKGGR